MMMMMIAVVSSAASTDANYWRDYHGFFSTVCFRPAWQAGGGRRQPGGVLVTSKQPNWPLSSNLEYKWRRWPCRIWRKNYEKQNRWHNWSVSYDDPCTRAQSSNWGNWWQRWVPFQTPWGKNSSDQPVSITQHQERPRWIRQCPKKQTSVINLNLNLANISTNQNMPPIPSTMANLSWMKRGR